MAALTLRPRLQVRAIRYVLTMQRPERDLCADMAARLEQVKNSIHNELALQNAQELMNVSQEPS